MKINYMNKTILITKESYKYQPGIFPRGGKVWEYDSIKYFYKCIKRYYKNTLKKNLTIVDIGAHVGLYTLYSKFLDNCSFYAFEPYSVAYNHLNNNIELNEIKNVKLFNIGLSDKKEEKLLKVPNISKGLATLSNNPLRMKGNKIDDIKVNVDTLDNLFYNKSICVDFIKIDTEGWEYFIIKGGLKTIETYKPLLQLEFNTINMKQCNLKWSQLVSLLKEINYVLIFKHHEEHVYVHNSKKNLY